MSDHVFISHSEKDKHLSDAVLSALENRDIQCWIAPRDISPGGSYAEAIVTAIEDCSCLVLIYTERSNGSGHVLREVERALKFEKNIVPIRFDESVPSRGLDYLLATVHWLSVTGESVEAGIARAADQIVTCVRPETAQPRPVPVAPVAKPPAPLIAPGKPLRPGRSTLWVSLLVGTVALALILGVFLTNAFRQALSAERARNVSKEMASPPAKSPTVAVTKLPAATSQPARTPAQTWDRPRIYLMLADESQRKAANELKRRLTSSGYVVVAADNVSGNVDIPTEAPELRYFTPTDSAEAQRIALALKPVLGNVVAYLPEGMPYVSHARQYEIWFSHAFR